MNWKCWAGIVALLALGVVGFAVGYLDPWQPHEGRCGQGDALRTARLLDEAKGIYDKDGDCDGQNAVELTEAEAEEYFATAAVYASTAPGNASSSKKAIDTYAAGLALDPFDREANLSLTLELNKELVDPEVQCETGENLVDDGLLTIAAVALANGMAVGIERCETTLAVALATRQTTASRHLIAAKAIEDETEARAEYAQALLANANLAAARTGLEGSLNDESLLDRIGAFIADIPGILETALKWGIPLAVGLFVLLLLLWMGVREAAARWRWARKRFEGLGSHPGLSFFRKAAVPDIEITPFGGKGESELEGADFSTLLRGEIYESTARGPAFPFDRVPVEPVADPEGGVTVTDLLTEIPATKLLGSVLQLTSKLFRRRAVFLGGHLTPPADKGAGVLLSVKGSRDRNASTTLWERVYDPLPGGEGAVRWLRLVPAAAIWAQWHLQWAQDPTKKPETESWEAQALFRSAEAWELKGDPSRAEALYVSALESDPGLLPAAHNLALIEIHRGAYARALERVEELRKALEEGVPCGRTAARMRCLWPTLDAASLYTLTLALAYLEPDVRRSRRGRDREDAVTTACTLVSTMARTLAAKDTETETRIETETKTKTQTEAETQTETGAGAVRKWWRRWKRKWSKQKETAEGEKSTEEKTEESRKLLLEALFEATEAPSVVILASLEIKNEADRKTAVEYATSSATYVAEVTRTELRDCLADLKPWQLIHGYVEKQANPPRRTYYNLACYYAALLQYAESDQKPELRKRALENLEIGLVSGELVKWAEEDPSLAPLREFRRYEFMDVLKARTIKSHEDEQKSSKQKSADE